MPSHLEDYLQFYADTKAPGYAVLVTGEWGVGKTYQVLKCLKEDERYYVSLFGLQSAADVHSAVLAEVDPKLAGAKRLLGGLEEKAASAGGWFAVGGLVPAALSAALRKEIVLDRPLVFDDLERSGLKLKDVLGVINGYVEQRAARVVVIAHDEKLADHFTGMKEKLFGQTIRVEPLVAEAFDKFQAELKSNAQQKFVERLREPIMTTFTQSGTKSLRILRHILEDLGRLHDALAPEHLAHDAAMSEMVPLFCAFDCEIRSGGIRASDMQDRNLLRVRTLLKARRDKQGKEEAEHPALSTAGEKYVGVDLESQLLPDDALCEMLIEGRYQPDTIRGALNGSHYFIRPTEAPPWKVVMSFDKLPDDVVESAAARMEEQFQNREVTESGEMLHIFALKMMMAENGISGENLETVTAACMVYVDEVLAAEKLPPRGTDWLWQDSFSQAHDGYGYWVTEASREHFQRVYRHLVAAREKALQSRFPEVTKQLLEYVQKDGQRFLEQVCAVGDGGQYALIPILAHIAPEEFVATWFGGASENWRPVSLALTSRFEGGRLEKELAEERGWILSVLDLVDAEADKAERFRAVRIRRVIHPKLAALREVGPPH